MKLIAPVIMTLLLSGMLAAPSPDELPPIEPMQSAFRFTTTLPDGATMSVVLDEELVFLSSGIHSPEPLVLLAPSYIHFRACWPCDGTTINAYAPLGHDGCIIGPDERDEVRFCTWPRNVGVDFTLPMYESNPASDPLFVWGDGCVIHERDGFPPQKITVEGVVLPATTLSLGAAC